MVTTALPVAIAISFYLRIVLFVLGVAALILAVVDLGSSWPLLIFTPIFLFHVAGVVNIALSFVSQGLVLLIIIIIDYYAFWLSLCTGIYSLLFFQFGESYDLAVVSSILHCVATGLVTAVVICDIIELHAHRDQGAAFFRSPRKCTLMSVALRSKPFRSHSILTCSEMQASSPQPGVKELQETFKEKTACY